jgi:hypothetical protein
MRFIYREVDKLPWEMRAMIVYSAIIWWLIFNELIALAVLQARL